MDVSSETIRNLGIKPGTRITLRDSRDDRHLAIITVQDIYKPDKYVIPMSEVVLELELMVPTLVELGKKKQQMCLGGIQSTQQSIIYSTPRMNITLEGSWMRLTD